MTQANDAANNRTTVTDGTPTGNGLVAYETIQVQGDSLVSKVKDLVHQGNVSRIVIANGDGHPVFEVPVNAGVVALVLAPVLTAVGAIALLASDWTLEVYRDGRAD